MSRGSNLAAPYRSKACVRACARAAEQLWALTAAKDPENILKKCRRNFSKSNFGVSFREKLTNYLKNLKIRLGEWKETWQVPLERKVNGKKIKIGLWFGKDDELYLGALAHTLALCVLCVKLCADWAKEEEEEEGR